jgi:hypothetical protein
MMPAQEAKESADQPVSERKIEANQENAQKSTGPRTVAGKLAVSQNAVKHGLRSRALPFRDEEEKTLSGACY